jgi:hypothetical protein
MALASRDLQVPAEPYSGVVSLMCQDGVQNLRHTCTYTQIHIYTDPQTHTDMQTHIDKERGREEEMKRRRVDGPPNH